MEVGAFRWLYCNNVVYVGKHGSLTVPSFSLARLERWDLSGIAKISKAEDVFKRTVVFRTAARDQIVAVIIFSIQIVSY